MRRTSPQKAAQLATLLSVLLLADNALAKRTGQNEPCNVCHEGLAGPELSAAFSMPVVAPSGSVGLHITARHPTALVGGVFVDTHLKGELGLVDTARTWLIEPGQGTHTAPQPYVSEVVEFDFNWVAPSEVGTTRFDIWSNAGNDNMMPADDSPSHIALYIAHGCEGTWYYPDVDLDGFGDQALGELSCEPLVGLITQGGDCDDVSTAANPGVVEICNNIDDNCDGQLDEGFDPRRHFVDSDGDGFGALGGTSIIGCSPIAGHAPTGGDCDDQSPAINPFASELQNGIDDNCDGQVDEIVKDPVTMPGDPPTEPGPGSPLGGADPGGCSLSAATPGPWPWSPVLLGLLWPWRRSWARRQRRFGNAVMAAC